MKASTYRVNNRTFTNAREAASCARNGGHALRAFGECRQVRFPIRVVETHSVKSLAENASALVPMEAPDSMRWSSIGSDRVAYDVAGELVVYEPMQA